MRKPPFALFERLNDDFRSICRSNGLNYQLIPYFISSHPGCTERDMQALAGKVLGRLHFTLEQVQDLTPTPMTLSSVMFYTGENPYTGEKGLRGTLAGGETPSEGYFFRTAESGARPPQGRRTTAPERRRPRLRHRETRRPTQCAPARKEPQEIKYRSAAPPRKSIRAIAGRRRQKAHAHRRIPTATIVPPQLVRRSAPSQPDQIGRCRSTVSRRCSLSRCV